MNYLFPNRPEPIRNGLTTGYEASPSSEFDGISQFGYRKPSAFVSDSLSENEEEEEEEADPFWK